MKKTKVGNWIVLGLIVIGFCASGYIVYTGYADAKMPDVSVV